MKKRLVSAVLGAAVLIGAFGAAPASAAPIRMGPWDTFRECNYWRNIYTHTGETACFANKLSNGTITGWYYYHD